MRYLTALAAALLLWHCAGDRGTDAQTPAAVKADPILVFSSTHSGNGEIYGLESLDGGIVNLTQHLDADDGPSWSPDGSRIAFSSARGGRRALYTMSYDGSDVQQLTNDILLDAYAPAWSPADDMIAYKSRSRHSVDIRFLSLTNSTDAILSDFGTEDLILGALAWSPLGTSIAIHLTLARNGIVSWAVLLSVGDGDRFRSLAKQAPPNTSLTWSPSGDRIAYVDKIDGGQSEIFVANRDGFESVNISRHPADDSFPAWSPDGTRIAFVTNRDGNPEIYSMDADGGNIRNLSRSPAYELEPRWSPDSRHIAYISATDGYALRLMDADGGNQTHLTRDRVDDFAWRPPSRGP